MGMPAAPSEATPTSYRYHLLCTFAKRQRQYQIIAPYAHCLIAFVNRPKQTADISSQQFISMATSCGCTCVAMHSFPIEVNHFTSLARSCNSPQQLSVYIISTAVRESALLVELSTDTRAVDWIAGFLGSLTVRFAQRPVTVFDAAM
jgi:hypothetical protein